MRGKIFVLTKNVSPKIERIEISNTQFGQLPNKKRYPLLYRKNKKAK